MACGLWEYDHANRCGGRSGEIILERRSKLGPNPDCVIDFQGAGRPELAGSFGVSSFSLRIRGRFHESSAVSELVGVTIIAMFLQPARNDKGRGCGSPLTVSAEPKQPVVIRYIFRFAYESRESHWLRRSLRQN